MSYINTVTIMSNITKTYVSENTSTVYETIYNKIASVTGWETSASGLLVSTGGKQLRINVSYLAGSYKFLYTIYSQNDNGNVNLTKNFNFSLGTSTYTLYLHYCKSKSGKTIGIGINISTSPVIDFIIAEDANGDFSAIGLNAEKSGGDYSAQMIWNGYKCNLSGTRGIASGSNEGALKPMINPSVSTSVCKLPNYLNGCMFKELYMILSLSINMTQLNAVILDIEGKKYQGCYSYDTSSTTSSTNENFNALAILAE